jgi:oligopeptide transport system substrate-binding protein
MTKRHAIPIGLPTRILSIGGNVFRNLSSTFSELKLDRLARHSVPGQSSPHPEPGQYNPRSRSVVSGSLVLAAVLIAGCDRPETAADRGVNRQVLHRSLGAEVPDLDPHLATTLAESHVVNSLFEGLVISSPEGGTPLPGVAESWTLSENGLVCTFQLRSDARWSDGSMVTATDFVESFHRVLSPELASGNATMLYPIRNARGFHQGEFTDFGRVGVKADSSLQLIVTLEAPCPYLLELATHWSWLPVPIERIARHGPVHERGSRWTRPGDLIGNGPFILEEWIPNQWIRVGRSPTYWDQQSVRLQRIVFHSIDSVNAEERAYRAGQLHITEALPLSKIDTYRRVEDRALRIEPFLSVYFYRLNVNHPILKDGRIRRALALSISKPRLVDSVLHGAQMPAKSFTPRGIGGYTPPTGLASDPSLARQLLADAGYPKGAGFPNLEILFNSSENHRLIAEAIQEMWRIELGIECRLVNQDLRVYLENRRSENYEICRSGWVADYVDPLSFLGLLTSTNVDNQTGWSDPEFDRLVDSARHDLNRQSRNDLFRRAELILLHQVPVIPLYHYSTIRLVDPRVQGWVPHPLDQHPFKFVYLEPLSHSPGP